MTLDPREGWREDGSGYCRGCAELTACAIVEGERRLPVCPDCFTILREHPEVKTLVLAESGRVMMERGGG